MAVTSQQIQVLIDGNAVTLDVDSDLWGQGTVAARPASGVNVGDLYLVVDPPRLAFTRWNGSTWENLQSDPVNAIGGGAHGDILYRDATKWTVLPAGTSGNVLQTAGAGAAPSWVTPSASDADAIHDNVAAEISAITEKTTPVGADLLLIEDSAAANVKKRVRVTNLPFDREFDAVVPDDYALPSAAFIAGHKSVLVRTGTYVETANVVIPNNGRLSGETTGSVIDLSGGGFSVVVSGAARKTTSGTITFTNNSTAVVGVGTSFTTLLAGDFIGLGAVFYRIASITDNTNLTLADLWEGRTRSGFPMFGVSMASDVIVDQITLKSSTSTGLALTAVHKGAFNKVNIASCLNNLLIVDCGSLVFDNCRSELSTNDGADLATSRTVRFDECHFSGNLGNGVDVRTSSLAIKFMGCEFDGNNLQGGSVSASSTDVIFDGCGSKNNFGNGITSVTGTTRLIVSNCTIQFNGGVGVSYQSVQSVVSGCQIGNNGGLGVQAGSAGLIASCHIHNNVGDGINLSSSEDTVISGCSIRLNGGDGIDIAATTNDNLTIAGCHIFENTGWGILLASGALNCVLSGNRVEGNTAGQTSNAEPTTRFVPQIPGNAAQGEVTYFNGTDWVRLAVGTSGQVLKTQGAGANPVWASSSGGLVQSLFFKFTNNSGSDKGDFSTIKVSANAALTVTFLFPSTFVTLLDLVIVGIPNGSFTSQDIDFTSDYGALGEVYNMHEGSNTTSVYSGTVNVLFEYDVTSLYPLAVAGDYAGLQLKHNAIGTTIGYLGLRMRFST